MTWKLMYCSFVHNLSPHALQILGSTYNFSLQELQRAFDDAKLGSATRYDGAGGCTWLSWLFLIFVTGMLVEVITIWSGFDGLSSPFRRCAVFFSQYAPGEWTFIVMFELVSKGYLAISCYTPNHADTVQTSEEASSMLGLRRLRPQNLCDKGLARQIHSMLEAKDERL